MGIVSGSVVFFLIWWTAIFAVLPWGLKRDERGMPHDPFLKRKFVITTAVSVFIWFIVYMMITYGAMDFRGLSEMMMRKDYGEK